MLGLALVFSVIGKSVSADGGPESVLLVVNSESASSLAVANLYIHLRDIPRSNVVYLSNVPPRELIKAPPFKRRILEPVLKTIDERGLADHIDYIVYSADFPTVVEISAYLQKFREKQPDLQRRAFLPWASINSLTYFYPSVLAGEPSFMLLDANWYARRESKLLLLRPFLGEDQKQYELGILEFRQGRFDKSAEKFRPLAEKHPLQVAARYQLARALAKQGESEQAITELIKAVRSGWCYRSFTETDVAFDDLREIPKFQQVVSVMPDQLGNMLPTRGFSNRVAWGPNGWPNSTLDQGKRLMLSTVLAVTRNRGTSLNEALQQLTITAAADGTHPQGEFYLAKHRDVRSRTRQHQFALTIQALKQLGLQGFEIPQTVPELRSQVLGASLGSATIDWARTKSRFVPGAIADNLTSTGGALRPNAKQTPLTEFIKFGAAGASGTVTEPLSIAAKFPNSMIHAHYARGCSLAEAFYQSVEGPFQLLIVGDPLCQPWAKFPKFEVVGLSDGQAVKGNVQMQIKSLPDSPRISRFEVYLDGRRHGVVALGQDLNLDTETLDDGYHEIRIVGVDATIIGTRSSQRIGFEVQNTRHRVTLTLEGSHIAALDGVINVAANANFGNEITIVQNSRTVAVINGNQGTAKVDGQTLGQGITRLVAVASEDDRTVGSRPVTVEITP